MLSSKPAPASSGPEQPKETQPGKYSIDRIPSGLKDLLKAAYLNSANTYGSLAAELAPSQPLKPLVEDYCQFDSVVNVSNENLNTAMKRITECSKRIKEVRAREKI